MEEQLEEKIKLNPEEAKKFSSTVDEIVKSMRRIKAEQDYIKEECASAKEKYGIPLPTTRKVATFILHEDKKDKAESELDLVDYLIELVK